MANIDNKVEQIRQAKFGKDVRESIASGIESINEEVENTTARQDVIDANEATRIAAENARESAEATRANTFNTNETNRQNTFNTNEDDRQDAFDAGETVRNNAETTRQSTFTTNESNRQTTFNTNETARQVGFDDMQETFDEVVLQAVFEGEEVIVKADTANDIKSQLAEKASQIDLGNKANLPTSDKTSFEKAVIEIYNFLTTKLSIDQIRTLVGFGDINKNLSQIDSTMLTPSLLAMIAGTAGVNVTPLDLSVLRRHLANLCVTPEKLDRAYVEGAKSANKFNKDTVTAGYYVNYATGALLANANYSASDYEPIKQSTAYIRTTADHTAFYDNSKTYISGTLSATFTTPSNAEFIRIAVPNAKLLTEQLEVGSTATNYESYGTKNKNKSIVTNNLNTNLQEELFTQFRFGKNFVYDESVTWTGLNTYGTSVAEIIANDGSLLEGKRYLKLTRGDTNLVGQSIIQDLPTLYKRNSLAKVRISVNYSSNVKCTLGIAQKTKVNAWCNPNTVVDLELPGSNNAEKQVSVIVPILWDAYFIVPYVKLLTSAGIVKIGSVRFSILGENPSYNNSNNPQTITVDTLGGGDFTTITAAINSITDSEKSKPYNIIIKNGVYNECNINILKDYISLEGESRDGTIIRADGTTLSGLPVDEKHGIMACINTTIKNLTIDVNETKYCVHNDPSVNSNATRGYYKAVFENCHFLHRGTVGDVYYHPVGIGAFNEQFNVFNDCIFESYTNNKDVAGIYWHNWNNQNAPCGLEVNNAININCKIATLTDLGSNYNDRCVFRNCTTNLLHKGITVSAIGSWYTPSVTIDQLPYCIDLTIEGNVNLDVDRTARPNTAKYHAVGWYELVSKNSGVSTIQAGYGIEYDYSTFTSNGMACKIAPSGVIDGIALVNITSGSNGYIVPKGKACKVFAKAATYVKGDMLKCNNDGTFSKTVIIAEKVVICTESKTLSTDGLLKGLVL